VGKTAIVGGRAQRINPRVNCPPRGLREHTILQPRTWALPGPAGAQVPRSFRELLRPVLTEVRAAAGRILLSWTELHTVVGRAPPKEPCGRGQHAQADACPARAAPDRTRRTVDEVYRKRLEKDARSSAVPAGEWSTDPSWRNAPFPSSRLLGGSKCSICVNIADSALVTAVRALHHRNNLRRNTSGQAKNRPGRRGLRDDPHRVDSQCRPNWTNSPARVMRLEIEEARARLGETTRRARRALAALRKETRELRSAGRRAAAPVGARRQRAPGAGAPARRLETGCGADGPSRPSATTDLNQAAELRLRPGSPELQRRLRGRGNTDSRPSRAAAPAAAPRPINQRRGNRLDRSPAGGQSRVTACQEGEREKVPCAWTRFLHERDRGPRTSVRLVARRHHPGPCRGSRTRAGPSGRFIFPRPTGVEARPWPRR